jgi:hypothetical protein
MTRYIVKLRNGTRWSQEFETAEQAKSAVMRRLAYAASTSERVWLREKRNLEGHKIVEVDHD